MPELDFLSEYEYEYDYDNDNDNDNDCSGGARFGGLRCRLSTLRPTALAPWSGHRRVDKRSAVHRQRQRIHAQVNTNELR